MSEPSSEEFAQAESQITVEAGSDAPVDVAFVVPAFVYDSIATDDELARCDEPGLPFSPAPSPTNLGPALIAIEAMGQTLGGKLDALVTLFDREIRAEATREKVVDRLHAELQEYKQDLLLNILRPMFVDLIQLHDDVGKMATSLRGNDGSDDSNGRFQELLKGVQQGVEDILYRQGVEPFSLDSDGFDARRQRAISTIVTDDPSLARKVADRHRKGFLSGEKVIRPEVVSVYVVRDARPVSL